MDHYVIKCPKEMTEFLVSTLKERGNIIKKYPGAILFKGNPIDIPEITRIFKVEYICKSDLEEIKKCAEKIKLKDCSFAVRTEKRGNKLDTQSIKVNEIIGEVILKNSENCKVDLSNPDVVIAIEVFDDLTAVCIVKGSEYKFSKYIGKRLVNEFLKKIKIAQMIYVGEGAYKMGERIGRAAQAFEIKELILFLHKKMPLNDVLNFLRGIKEGIKSRYEIQKKIYNRKVEKISTTIYDVYHLVPEEKEKGSFVIITDPRGKSLEEAKEDILKAMKENREILVVNGANEGVPVGLFRYADVIVDLAPGITFATEHAIPTVLTYLIMIYEESLKNNEN